MKTTLTQSCVSYIIPEYCTDIERRMAHVHAPRRVRKATVMKAKGKTEGAGPLFDDTLTI